MNMKVKTTLLMAAIMVSMSLVAFTSAASVTPTLIDPFTSGNGMAEASSLGYDYGYKIDDWDKTDPTETYHVTESGFDFYITIFNVVYDEGEIKSFDWSSTLPIDAVIVKGGKGANVFKYDPAATGDTNLYAPSNKGISHVTFCWDTPDFYIPETPWGVIGTMLTMLAAVALYTRKGLTIKL
jgi:hypothetical protein